MRYAPSLSTGKRTESTQYLKSVLLYHGQQLQLSPREPLQDIVTNINPVCART